MVCQQLGKGPVGCYPHPLRNGRVRDLLCFCGPSCMSHEQCQMKLQLCMHLHESFRAICCGVLQLFVQLHGQLLGAVLHHFCLEMLHPSMQLHESVSDVLLHPYETAEAACLKLSKDSEQCPVKEGRWNDSEGQGGHRYHSSGHKGTTRGQEEFNTYHNQNELITTRTNLSQPKTRLLKPERTYHNRRRYLSQLEKDFRRSEVSIVW